jgi:hypothetical protein
MATIVRCGAPNSWSAQHKVLVVYWVCVPLQTIIWFVLGGALRRSSIVSRLFIPWEENFCFVLVTMFVLVLVSQPLPNVSIVLGEICHRIGQAN